MDGPSRSGVGGELANAPSDNYGDLSGSREANTTFCNCVSSGGLGLAGQEGVDGGGELVAAVKELELEEEDEAEEVAAHLLDQLAAGLGRAACGVLARVEWLIQCAIDYDCEINRNAIQDMHIPVAIMSSTTITFWPGLIAPACIWKKSVPYSFS